MKGKKRFGLLVALCLTIVMLVGLTVFASPVSAEVKNGWINNEGKWYYYEEDVPYVDGIYVVDETTYYFDADGVMADGEWILRGEDWYYAKSGGALANNEICNIGGVLYGFNDIGQMFDDERAILSVPEGAYLVDRYVTAKPGGALYAGEWELHVEGDYSAWHYYCADGYALRNCVERIDGVLYGFGYDASMYDNVRFAIWYGNGDDEYMVGYWAKPGGALFENEWYLYEDAEYNGSWWYYFGENGAMPHGYAVVDGTPYLFNYGEMMDGPNCLTDDEDNLYFVGLGGKATPINANGWTKIGNRWVYAVDGQMYEYGIYEIDGAMYAFSGDFMIDDDDYQVDYATEYRAQAGGALYRNAWYYDGNWYYYGDDYAAYYEGVYNIDGNWYMFNYGCMTTNWEGAYEDGYYYVADEDGNLTYTQNGWLLDNEGNWMWIVDGEKIYYGLYEINGVEYIFAGGRLAPNDLRYIDALDGYVVSNEDGTRRTQPGWYAVEGDYVYVGEDGFLLENWQNIDGVWYWFTPYMEYGTLKLDWSGDAPVLYAFNAAGQYSQVTADGMYTDGDGDLVLIENGAVVANSWRLIDGKWYYFGNGYAYRGYYYIDEDDSDDIDGTLYYFDGNSQMISGGWYQGNAGMWLYATESGALYTDGVYEIGGIEYEFDYEGWLITDSVRNENGELVVIDGSGALTRYPLAEGWNLIGGEWYFCFDGRLVYGEQIIDEDQYYFYYEDYTMVSDTRFAGAYYGTDGRAKTGWFRVNGDWMYADEDYYLYDSGEWHIDGKTYLFLDSKLVVNQTVTLWGTIYTTDANGVIVDRDDADAQIKDGWNYVTSGSYGEYGSVVYYQDGMPYTGWLGDYYFKDGRMLYSEGAAIDGEIYIFGEDGHLLRNGWLEMSYYEYTFYSYGDANGHPCNEQWLQSGGNWYYFRDYYTLFAGVYEIDGVKHVFDENSVWLGEYKEDTLTGLADGWNYVNGNWYYAMAGEPVYGKIYDGGAWYFCEEDGMVTNGFVGEETSYYYGASGARAEYVGWHMIDGRWVYFHTNHSVELGWLDLGGTRYYIAEEISYNGSDYSREIGMVTGSYVIDGQVCHFDASGAYTGTVTTDGWVLVGTDWYYVRDGRVCRGDVYEINGALYVFDYEGKMQSNCMYYDMAFGADGAAVENGWVMIDGRWHYVKSGVICNGIHLIDGVVYYFDPVFGD